jgi:16S rRNA (uracil1498-N3)-methyltransferase
MAMRIDRFYLSGSLDGVLEDKAFIHKVRNVLRKKIGDELVVFDGRGREYRAVIEEITKHQIVLGGLRLTSHCPYPDIVVTLAFGLLKADHTDMIFQRCTELGVNVFLPYVSAYTATGIPRTGKTEHWRRVLEEASSQSRRLWVPDLKDVCRFEHLCEEFAGYDRVLIGDPYSSEDFSTAVADMSAAAGIKILIVVGPEGGLSEDELVAAAGNGGRRVRISRFMLRAETAAIHLTGLSMHYLEKKRS